MLPNIKILRGARNVPMERKAGVNKLSTYETSLQDEGAIRFLVCWREYGS